MNQIKGAIFQDSTRPIRRLFNDAVHQQPAIDSDEDDFLPEFHSIRSSLARKRQQLYPAIPRRVRDIKIRGQWKKNWQGQELICHQDRRWGLVIMMSSRCASYVQNCQDLYVDGTFKTCPKPFVQVITVHGRCHGRVLPFAFVMLKSKEVALYREMFRQLKCKVLRFTGHRLRPRRILCDFEIALMSAAEAEFQQSSIVGCYFHFCQNIWRKVQNLGLSVAYRRNLHVKKFVRKVMTLAYLPVAVVRINFRLMFTSTTVRRLIRQFPAIAQFITYFERNYINGVFKPKVWNVYERDVDFRTNNHVEGMKQYCFVGDSYSRANPVEECLLPYSVRQSRPLFYYKLL